MTAAEKDLALVRRVAELMGILLDAETWRGRLVRYRDVTPYDPLTDDAQCFAVQMRMRRSGVVVIRANSDCAWIRAERGVCDYSAADCSDAACRRAILECFVKGSES
jgi:hypothetical protein